MSKATIARFENLAAPDDTVRLAAATELQALGPEYFTKHSVGKWQFSWPQLQALQAAYQSTASDLDELLLNLNQQPEATRAAS